MNLIQIQDRLKGMPMQAVMAYANGSNPEVPPYVALGELNRRKQMEQQAAEPPQGSVKDNVEQSLMARDANQQRMLGVPQPMQPNQPMQPMGGMPDQMPEAGSNAQAFNAGGVAALPVRNEMFNYASGGIIAFKDRGLVEDDEKEPMYADLPKRPDPLGAIGRGLANLVSRKEIAPMRFDPVDESLLPASQKIVDGTTADQFVARARANNQKQGIPFTPQDEEMLRRRFAGAEADATVTPPPVVARPPQQIPQSGIASNPAGNSAAQFLAKSFQTTPAAITPYAPPVQAPIGQKMEQYLNQQQEEDAAMQAKFKDAEQQRAKLALYRNLIAGGEATRGGGGIGTLFAGYGKSALAEQEAALGRDAEQDKLMRERKANNVKLNSEIENLRRAEERNDAKAIYDSKIKIQELERQSKDLQQRAAERVYAETESNKRTNLSREGSPSEIRFINDYLARNPNKTYSDAYAAYKMAGSAVAGERQDLAELKALQKTYTELSDPTKNFDKESRDAASRSLIAVNRKLESMAGIEQPAKVMTQADVTATAKSSGKTEKQVIEAAKAQGYTIK
jgi:hypothetical protein